MSLRGDIDALTERVNEIQEFLDELDDRAPVSRTEREEHVCRVDIRPLETVVSRLEEIETGLLRVSTRATLPARIADMLRAYEPKAGDHGKLSTEGWAMVKQILNGIAQKLDIFA